MCSKLLQPRHAALLYISRLYEVKVSLIDIGSIGAVFTWYPIDTKIRSIAQHQEKEEVSDGLHLLNPDPSSRKGGVDNRRCFVFILGATWE